LKGFNHAAEAKGMKFIDSWLYEHFIVPLVL
jgi:hypothetical protein